MTTHRRLDIALAVLPVAVLVLAVVAWPEFGTAFTYAPPAFLSQPVAPYAVTAAAFLAAAALVAMRHTGRRWWPLLAVLVVPFLAVLVLLPGLPAWVQSISPR